MRCNRELKDPAALYGWRCALALGLDKSSQTDVTIAQKLLNQLGYRDTDGRKLKEDGIYGAKTAYANALLSWPPWLVDLFISKKDKKFINEELNDEERALMYRDPFGAQKIKNARDIAFEKGMQIYGEELYDLDDIEANAFRHAYWNAIGTFDIGAKRTKAFTDAHEAGYSGPSTDMDFYNNDKGREIALMYMAEINKPSVGRPEDIPKSFLYYGVSIPLTGNHYENLALMVKTAADQGNGVVLMWLR